MPTKNKLLFTQVFIVAAVIAAFSCVPSSRSNFAAAQTRSKQQVTKHYACPMHPEVKAARARKCPKCGMSLRLVAAPVDAGTATAANSPSAATTTALPGSETTTSFSLAQIPDVPVFDQNGKRLNFYRDLIKGKTVAINFIFTTCTTICPSLTATFRRVQLELAKSAPGTELISISVDPTIDTPQRLNDFATKFKAGSGWTFVTGDNHEITRLLGALGASVSNKNDHTPIVLIGNDGAGYWTRAYGLSSPSTLAKLIADAANHK